MNAIAIRDDAKLIIEDIAEDLRMALPATIPLDRFKATFITAVAHNPDILTCDVQSIKTALMKAASDNLMPDNREAALVPFNTKVKNAQGKEEWKKLAQYMPMVQGIRKRALELGGARITAECVYENDHFDAVLGDDPHIEHKPAKLGQPRGEIIGSYAIFKDEQGNILHREIMAKEDVESTRKVSRSKDGPAWREFFGEMAKKAVVRRGSKSVPSLPEKLRTVIERDDEYADFTQISEKPRTIEHNPLLESNPPVPVERVDTSTGEIIQTRSSSADSTAADEGSGAGTDKAVDAAPANSPEDTSPSGDKAAERETSSQRSAASDHAMTAAELKKVAGFMCRQDSIEKLNRAAAAIKAGQDGITAPNEADMRLLGTLKGKLAKVIESGEGGASDELDAFNSHIDTIFVLDDFPGDK